MIHAKSRSIAWRTACYFLGVFLPVFAVILLTGFAGYRLQVHAEENLAEKNEQLLVDFQATLLSNQLNSVIEDMKYLATLGEGDYASLSREYASFLRRKMSYSSLRIFDGEGKIVLSITYEQGSTVVTPASGLERVESRYELQNAFALDPKTVFVSRMDLSGNRRPIIRFITPVLLNAGDRVYIELVYDGRRLVNIIRNASKLSIGDTMLLNAVGYWIVSPRRDDEWGFLNASKIDRTFAAEHGDVWREMMPVESGVFRDVEGVFAFRAVYPLMDPHSLQMNSGWDVVFDPGPYDMFSRTGSREELHWYLVSFVPHSRIREQVAPFLARLGFVISVATVLLASVAFLLSISRKRRLTAEAKVEEEAAIFVNNPAPVIRIGNDGSVVGLNPAASRIFHRTGTGARSSELFPAFDALNTHRLSQKEPYQFEQQIEGRDYLFTVKKGPLDQSCLLYGSDVTGIKEIEDELQRLSTAVQQSATAILITDTEGNITFANDSCVQGSGYSADELVGSNTRIFKSGYQSADVYAGLWRTISAGEVWHGSLRNRRKDGEIYWEDISITPLRSEKGEVNGYLAVKEDITYRMEVEDQLRSAKDQAEAASRLKSQFLANMSHEIRTPMNAIIGFTDVLLDAEEREEQRKHLQIIKRSGKHLLSLIHDILDFSKIEADKITIEANPFAIRRVLDHLGSLLDESVREKSLSFDVAVDPSVPAVISGDEHRITQILLNVLSNAIKFTHSGGVSLSCDYSEGELVLSISDTGIGIEEEKLASIFLAFEQASSSTEQMYGGTGLGLAITRRLVDLMNGSIDVTSSVGEGSTFLISLPLPEVTVESVELAEEVLDASASGVPGTMVERWLAAMGDDEPLQGVLRKGIRDLPVKLKKLEAGLASADLVQVRAVAHDLKGYSGNLCMLEIYEIARELHDGILEERVGMDECRVLLGSLQGLINTIPDSYFSDPNETGPARAEGKPVSPADTSPAEVLRNLKVLTGEDNEANRELFKVLLDGLGVHSSFVGNGREVIETLRSTQFDVLLLDMQMPVMDGLETLHMIRANHAWDSLHIIAITAHAMEGDAERYLSFGCNDYMSKPIDFALFRKRIQDIAVKKGITT